MRRTRVYFIAIAIACSLAGGSLAQDSVADRLRELESELAQTQQRTLAIEAEITTLRAILLGGGEAIRAARAIDEQHEFISYPFYRFDDPALYLAIRREGYTVVHDNTHRLPRWVSQKITRQWVDAAPAIARERISWRTDPELAGIGARDSDYTNSGYSRGHQAMQATLYGRSEDCERQGMYLANAAPQTQAFNNGIWATLERQVIAWAQTHGEVWMMCGPVLRDNPRTLKNAGRVSIPSMFYKIVGRDTDDGIAIIAFLFEHDPDEPHGPLDDYIVSVRTIENWTGIDFFWELPREVQDVLERKRFAMSFDGAVLGVDDPADGAVAAGANMVYVTGFGTRYHIASCRFVRSGATALPLDEARGRFEPCSVCGPPQ